MSALLPSPHYLGLPAQFTEWYPHQDQAVSWIMDRLFDESPRFLALSAPTGSGKSAIAALSPMLSGKRTVILTATKALQTQYRDQLGNIGIADLRGANAYHCTLEEGLMADEGPCRVGVECSAVCPHREALKLACDPVTALVLTNYACWMHNSGRITGIELLILDEAHRAYDQLSSFLGMDFRPEDALLQFPSTLNLRDWKLWATYMVPMVTQQLTPLDDDIRELVRVGSRPPRSLVKLAGRLRGLKERLTKTATLDSTWVVGQSGNSYTICPIWPASHADTIFRGTPKILLMSATLTPKTMELLGVKDYDFLELPSSFPPANRPVIHVPTVSLTHDSTMDEQLWWVSVIDQIIDGRLDKKGIIHTTSYPRARFLVKHSRHRDIMVTHEARNLQSIVRAFKSMSAPAVLVSPAITDGYDFPDCGYNVIGKLPFPDPHDPITAARTKVDPDWPMYSAMQVLVQEAGRTVRSPSAKSEILIIDDNWKWFWKYYKRFAPMWFAAAIQWAKGVPNPRF